MQSEAVKYMVRDMETVESLLGNKGRFVGDMVHISIKDLAQCIAAQSPAVEVVTVDDAINAMILNLSRPAEGEHDPFLAAKTSFAIKAVEAIERAGWRIIKSPEGV